MVQGDGSRPRASLQNTLIGAITFFVCFSLYFLYHGHLNAEKMAHESILSQLQQLQNSLKTHVGTERNVHEALDHNVQGMLNVQEQIPFLAKTISNIKAGTKENLEGIDGKVSGLTSSLTALKNTVEILQAKISSQEKQGVDTIKNADANVGDTSVASNQRLRGSADVIAQKTSLGLDTVLLVIASSKRSVYLKRCLEKVVEYHPLDPFTIVVSQDGDAAPVNHVVNSAIQALADRYHSVLSPHKVQPSLLHIKYKSTPEERGSNGYFALSAHFKWALNQVFQRAHVLSNGETTEIKRVIILEEDLEISPDFYEYFGALAPLLDRDEKLLTISAWNDNGQAKNVRDPQALARSDFFPGLGWMMTQRLYKELIPKWPKAYWDDWLREPLQRRARHSIHPEISRTLHFGKNGVSGSQFQEAYMDTMRLNGDYIHFSKMDLKYLEKDDWDHAYIQRVHDATLVTAEEFDVLVPNNKRAPSLDIPSSPQEYRVEYIGNLGFEKIAHWAGVMDNIKANVPRTAYKGIVSLWVGDVRLHLVPKGF